MNSSLGAMSTQKCLIRIELNLMSALIDEVKVDWKRCTPRFFTIVMETSLLLSLLPIQSVLVSAAMKSSEGLTENRCWFVLRWS